MPLPKDKAKLFKLLKKLSETNYEVPGHARLATDSKTVWSVVAHSVGDIGPGRRAQLHLRLPVARAGHRRRPPQVAAARSPQESVATTGAWSLVPISRNDGQETARAATGALAST